MTCINPINLLPQFSVTSKPLLYRSSGSFLHVYHYCWLVRASIVIEMGGGAYFLGQSGVEHLALLRPTLSGSYWLDFVYKECCHDIIDVPAMQIFNDAKRNFLWLFKTESVRYLIMLDQKTGVLFCEIFAKIWYSYQNTDFYLWTECQMRLSKAQANFPKTAVMCLNTNCAHLYESPRQM